MDTCGNQWAVPISPGSDMGTVDFHNRGQIWDMACHVTRVLCKKFELLDTGGINETVFFSSWR